jgi:hypothetical protein
MKMSRLALAGSALLVASLALAQVPATSTTTDAAAAAPATPAKKLSYTDDYRISVDEDADSDGVIVFRVTPKGGAAQDITVTIKNGTGENDVARAIKKAFEEQLGTKEQSIEMEDGENVIIERSMGTKDISLLLISSTVKGPTIKVHRD